MFSFSLMYTCVLVKERKKEPRNKSSVLYSLKTLSMFEKKNHNRKPRKTISCSVCVCCRPSSAFRSVNNNKLYLLSRECLEQTNKQKKQIKTVYLFSFIHSHYHRHHQTISTKRRRREKMYIRTGLWKRRFD